jgi:hypothetical protein
LETKNTSHHPKEKKRDNMDKRKETKERRNPQKEQNKKKGREEANHAESFKSMFL